MQQSFQIRFSMVLYRNDSWKQQRGEISNDILFGEKWKQGLTCHTHPATKGGSESKAVYGFNEFSCEAEILSMTGCHFISASKGNDLKGVEPFAGQTSPSFKCCAGKKRKGMPLLSVAPLSAAELRDKRMPPLSAIVKGDQKLWVSRERQFPWCYRVYCWELFTVSESVTLAAKSWKKKFFSFIVMQLIYLLNNASD